jgi:nucleoid DNA-binding protein
MDDQSLSKAEELMDFTTLIAELCKQTGLTKSQVQLLMKSFAATVGASLKEGKSVRVARFGTFKVKETVSPIAPKRVVFFAAKDLKDASF